MKKKQILFLSLALLFSGKSVLAITYPDLPGVPSLGEDSILEDYVAYFYALIVALMMGVAVLKVALTGINLLMSEGDPKAFSSFKAELIGVIIGIVVLLSPIILMNIINKDPAERETIECSNLSNCILRERSEKREDGTIKIKKSTEMTIQNQDLSEGEKITIKKYYGLQNVITFNNAPAVMVYSDDPENDDNSKSLLEGAEVIVEGPQAGGNGQKERNDPEKDNNNSGLVIVEKRNGAFFYEKPEYVSYLYPPLYLRGTYGNLNDVNYMDSIGSIDIVNTEKDKGIDYFGILSQEEASMIGKCGVFSKDVIDVANDPNLKKLEGKMNYATIFKRDKNYFKNLKIKVFLYNSSSCSEKGGEDIVGKADNQLRYCEIIFKNADGDIADAATNSTQKPVCSADNYSCLITLNAIETINSPEEIGKMCPNLGRVEKRVPSQKEYEYRKITDVKKWVPLGYLGKKLLVQFDIDWDGEAEVGISGANGSVQPVWVDDTLFIANETNGQERIYYGNERKITIGDIASMLSPGKNTLSFYIQDIGDSHGGIEAAWLYIASKKEILVGGIEVYSFRIDTPSAVVFLDSGDRCNIFDDDRIGRGEGVCNQVNFKGSATAEFIPKKLFIIPYNK